MEIDQLPRALEQIVEEAEVGAAKLTRGLIVFVHGLLRDLVATLGPTEAQGNSKAPATGSLNTGQFLSVAEAAEFLRVKPSTIYSWVSGNKIPHSKVGSRVLFDRNELVEFAKRNEK